MSGNGNSGGVRRGAGPPRRNLSLSKVDARNLHRLLKHQRAVRNAPDLTEETLVAELVEREWREIDQEYTKGAEMAHEPYVL